MQRRAQTTSQPGGMASAPTAHAGAEAGDGLSSLLGAGPFLEAVIEHIPAVVFVKDATDFRFILLNRAGEEFLGAKREAIIGRTDHDVFPKDEADRFVARDHEVLKSRQVEIFEEEPVHTPHNGLRFLRTRMIVICDDQDQPQYLLGISEDVTDQKLKSERIRHMAHHDGLTDLANRALFRQRLDAAMAEYRCTRRGVVLFFIDLDGFKRLNDTLGHPTGDAVLRLLAERIRRCAHDGDTVARLGGDEFAIVHPVLPTSKSPTAMATELVRSIARPYDVGGSQLTLTASVGVSVAGEDCQEP